MPVEAVDSVAAQATLPNESNERASQTLPER
jgi:hypothetical protein